MKSNGEGERRRHVRVAWVAVGQLRAAAASPYVNKCELIMNSTCI